LLFPSNKLAGCQALIFLPTTSCAATLTRKNYHEKGSVESPQYLSFAS